LLTVLEIFVLCGVCTDSEVDSDLGSNVDCKFDSDADSGVKVKSGKGAILCGGGGGKLGNLADLISAKFAAVIVLDVDPVAEALS